MSDNRDHPLMKAIDNVLKPHCDASDINRLKTEANQIINMSFAQTKELRMAHDAAVRSGLAGDEREALWDHIRACETILLRIAMSKKRPISEAEWEKMVTRARELLEMKP